MAAAEEADVTSIFDDATASDPLTETAPESSLYDGDTSDDKDPVEKRPKKLLSRTSAATLITFAWGGAGSMLIRSGADVPVGRVLQFQAPLAGQKLDELIAHTWLDTVIQPFVAQMDKIEGLGSIIMFPLLIGAYERNPSIGDFVEPILRQVIHETLVDMAPVIRKRKTQERAAAKSLDGLNELLGIDKNADPVDAILASIFAPVPQAPESPMEDSDTE